MKCSLMLLELITTNLMITFRLLSRFFWKPFSSFYFHCCREWGCVRRRKRHDTSDSETGLGSPRKREGGSLPCDVARGFKGLDKPVSMRISHIDNPLSKDCVINMEGVIEDDRRSTGVYDTEDRFPQPWNLHLKSSERCSAPGTLSSHFS